MKTIVKLALILFICSLVALAQQPVTISGNPAMNVAQVNGSTVATAATGIQKVGLTDGTGNAITSTSSALDVNIKSGAAGGLAVIDEATATAGTSTFTPGGGVFNDSFTNLSSGQQGLYRMTAARGEHVNLRNSSGTEIGTSSTPIQVSLANTATNATPVSVGVAPSTSSSFAFTRYHGTSSTSTYTNIKASAGNLYGLRVFNPNTVACYVQFYNSATPTLGAAVVDSFGVQAGLDVTLTPNDIALENFATAISYATSTTDAGASLCATALSVTVFYQ